MKLLAHAAHMLRKKNALMRSGKVEQAAALSKKIGEAIKKYNTSELDNVDMLSDSKSVWAKVRQLTGRSKTTMDESHNATITADSLNRHYAEISTWLHDSNARRTLCLSPNTLWNGEYLTCLKHYNNNNNNFRWDLRDQVQYKKLLGHGTNCNRSR